ncbi:hypothetical protein [Streptomyces marincola]|uniref:NlpC/P60 family protein n=1 Tax=Streptomyces marincola TaxID=2878388 RepID=A0A1W7CV62_9ACTN|nr:hypothetical protein [Streptomyces marincola]ARQ68569.1 hypothetical protein CAG99_06600 [Streptomyces marincola]
MRRPALILAAGLLAWTGGGAPAAAGPGDEDPAALLAELRTLHHETGRAAEAYNEAEARLRERHAEALELDARLAAARTELAGARRVAGAVAREQYRRGGVELPGYLRLLLGEDVPGALHARTVADRAARAQTTRIARLAERERRAQELATRAREALDAEQSAAAARREERDEAHRRLDETAGLLAGLGPEEAARLGATEDERLARARRDAGDGPPAAPLPLPAPGAGQPN